MLDITYKTTTKQAKQTKESKFIDTDNEIVIPRRKRTEGGGMCRMKEIKWVSKR